MLEDFNLQNFKGALFDLDDTLYGYTFCHQKAYNKCMDESMKIYDIKNEMFEAQWKIARQQTNIRLNGQAAAHSRLLYFHAFYEQIFGCSNPSFALKMENVYWNEFLSHMEWNQRILEFVKSIKAKGLKTCVVTDLTAQIQFIKWNKLELNLYFDFIVTSEEAGIEKPSSKIFNLALSKMKLEAKDVFMVGDNFEKDIQGAEKLKIKTIHIIND